MNRHFSKRLVAGLVAMSVSAVVWGQVAPTQVTLSGTIDVYAGRDQLSGRVTRAIVNPSGLTTSFWGLQVVEDLGGGLRAQVFLSSFLTADNGGSGRYSGDVFFSRRSTVGLAGNFGEVNIGRMNSPFFFTLVAFDPFAGGSLGPIFQQTYPGGQPLPAPMVTADSGIQNTVNYQSPLIAGFRLNSSFGLGEQSGAHGRNRFGNSLTYTNGPLSLAVASEYNRSQLDAGEKRQEDLMLAGSYDFGVVRSFVQLARHKKAALDLEYKTSQLGASIPISLGFLLASWGRTRYETPVLSQTRNSVTVSYDYFLSRRTDIYAGAETDKITGLSRGNSLFSGLRHRF